MSYACSIYQNGGVCIYIRADLEHTPVHLMQFCEYKNFEMCAIKILSVKIKVFVLCTYRSPSGNSEYFIKMLDKVLKFYINLKVNS
jgi:hypothetical protein